MVNKVPIFVAVSYAEPVAATFKLHLWIGNSPTLHQKILHALHGSLMGGHSGFQVTCQHIKAIFISWHKMTTMVKEFVSHCSICQQSKVEQVRYPRLLQPLHVPDHSWQVISMDFIEGLSLLPDSIASC